MIVLAAVLLQQPVPTAHSAPYWQQDVAYEITATLDEASGVLAGGQAIRYRNNSPDTLKTFSLHLYLNAFRPGSLWSAADSAEGRRRFNDLPDPEFAFNHVRNVRIMDRRVKPSYPFAPDSTVVRFTLPRPLAPGDSMSVALDWDARPSTLPRRQGRQGRRFDFAQWYPAVVVYDRHGWNEHPLRPAGEFYGEFGSFRVDLDVAEDQVIGATGVPVCGDPGWERANRDPSRPVEYLRDYYGASTPSADVCSGAGPGRKRMRWYAEKVHHFAFSLNPEYRYEGGRFKDVAIHVLYQPGDESTWGHGIAIERTTRALAWLDQLFGPFGWPQFTNLHRIEGGGTEFPMVIMTGGADQGLILHETGHNYVQGLLANNEWREGWLDEGFTTFQSTWYWELNGRPSTYPRNEANVLMRDLDGESEPVSQPSEDYRDFTSYNIAINTRGELFFHQLRYAVGDETMVRILRTYYERWKYKHVDENALKSTAEEVSGRDLSALFTQWLHTTELYDYAAGKVRTRQEDSLWVTEAEVLRKAPGEIPVLVAVIAESDTAVAQAEGAAERDTVQLVTRTRPRQVIVDPIVHTHDWNMTNNYRDVGFRWSRLLGAGAGTEVYFHPYVSTRSRRERATLGIHPTAWYNEGGGITLGARTRSDYLGRFDQHVLQLNYSTGWDVDGAANDVDFLLHWKNPTFLRAPHMSQMLDLYRIEGRYGAGARVGWEREGRSAGIGLTWLEPDDFRYLDRGFYEDTGILELEFTGGIAKESDTWRLGLRSSIAGGWAYDDAARDPVYGRATLTGTARAAIGERVTFGSRAYLGAAGGAEAAPKQRQVYLQGADPLEQFSNPFLRSRGALLVGNDFRYHAIGGAGVRGADPRVSTSSIAGLSVELEGTVVARPKAKLFHRVGLAVFSDLAQGLGGPVEPRLGERLGFVADAGIGVRAYHRIGDTGFTTRLDFPLYLSRSELAHGAEPGDGDVEFRWTFGFEPAIP